jgi:hypothetical protein
MAFVINPNDHSSAAMVRTTFTYDAGTSPDAELAE